tara:strand:+ start:129 stop:704 length:576 start_codon:yes stop_codon:yes gene_type:complete
MNKLSLYTFLILIFVNTNNLRANDINEYEIEGIRIGDSILSFFTIEKINSGLKDWYPDQTFSYTEFSDSKIRDYDKLGFFFKPGDKKYKIYSISGMKFCDEIQDCFNMQKDIEKNFETNFKYLKKNTQKINYPNGGKQGTGSFAIQSYWRFKNGEVFIETKNWAKDSSFNDNVSINIDSKEFSEWLVKISN